MKELLAKVPYWKAIGLFIAGATALLWLQSQMSAAVALDNVRDDGAYASFSTVQDVRERMVRVEEKIDQLLRRK